MSSKRWWLILIAFLSFHGMAKPVLKACLDEYPPYQILGNPPVGEYVSALEALAHTLDMALVYETEPDFSHCLEGLRNGHIDVMAGLAKTTEREPFMYFLPMRRETHYVFVTRNSAAPIDTYDDLQERLIAVAKEYSYFSRFNEDQSLHKIAVDDVHMAYTLLLAGRVDVVVSSAENLSAILAGNPALQQHIRVHRYQPLEDRVVYFGLSKRSAHAEQLNSLHRKVNRAFEQGVFQQAIEDFIQQNPEYYELKPPRIVE